MTDKKQIAANIAEAATLVKQAEDLLDDAEQLSFEVVLAKDSGKARDKAAKRNDQVGALAGLAFQLRLLLDAQ